MSPKGALEANDIGDIFETYHFEVLEERNFLEHFDIFPID